MPRVIRRSRDFWLRLVVQYDASSESQREFAARHGVKLATLRDWLYRRCRTDKVERSRREVPQPQSGELARTDAGRSSSEGAPRWLPVRVIPTPAASSEDGAVVAILPSGVRVCMPATLGVEFVAGVLRRLG